MFRRTRLKSSQSKKHWLTISLTSAATLTAALIAAGTVQADHTQNWSYNWGSNREIGIYNPDVPDIEDDPSILDENQPAPKPQENLNPRGDRPYRIYDENGERYENRIVPYQGKLYGTDRYGVAYTVTDDPAEQIPTDLKNSFYTSPTGNVYYFDGNGHRVTTFFNVNGTQYYFDEKNGQLVRNRFVTFWEYTFYIGQDGTLYKDGLYKIGDRYYAFTENGYLYREASYYQDGYRYWANRYGVIDITKRVPDTTTPRP